MVLSKREFIKDIILEQQHNNKIAIEDEKEHITYRELHNTCTKISETIQREIMQKLIFRLHIWIEQLFQWR